jgi:hypothetical protein
MKSISRITKAVCAGIAVSAAVFFLKQGYVILGFAVVFIFVLYVMDSIERINKARLAISGEVPMCYRIQLKVSPNWERILSIPIKDKEAPYRVINRIRTDPEARLGEWSIFGREFSYTIFTDELSGLCQIWSKERNGFVDDMEEYGRVGGNAEVLEKKYNIPSSGLSKTIIISPSGIAYGKDFGMGAAIEKEQVLSEIPYELIIKHLKMLYTSWGDAMKGILAFPSELQSALSQTGVKYETWDNEDYGTGIGFTGKPIEKQWAKYAKKAGFDISYDKMKNHVFSAKYCSISINIKFFR